jgi:hypothetical protein
MTGNYFLHCQYLLMMMPMMMARGLDDSALLLSFTLIHLRGSRRTCSLTAVRTGYQHSRTHV